MTCCGISDEEKSKKWYEYTKDEILKQANLKADSIAIVFIKDSTIREEYLFSELHLFKQNDYFLDTLIVETYYSKNSNFELRREICRNGNYGFEGIFYKDNFYGLSSWWYCNGQLQSQGVRHNGEWIGIWKHWNEDGYLISETDYHNTSKLDSMPQINNGIK